MKIASPNTFAGRSMRALLSPMLLRSETRLRAPLPVAFGGQVDRTGQCPVILPGRGAVAQNAAVADRQLGRFAAEHLRRLRKEQCAHVGTGLPHGDAAELDRLAAGGIALIRRLDRVAGAMVMRSIDTSSSSAAICLIAVSTPGQARRGR
jgi:hypothetical protein